MIRLTPLGDIPPFIDRYKSIRDSKRLPIRRSLTAQHAYIEHRYVALTTAIAGGALSGMTVDPRSLPISDALRSCYSGPTKSLRTLKTAIESAQPKRLLKYCPLCGTTLPATFDHYLPAAKFPEFSVHPLNLVPCCATCNSTKDDDWLSNTGDRQYLHAFSDDLPDQQFVVADLHEHAALRGVGATFSLLRPAGVTNAAWRLIMSHFDRLHLLTRYGELGNDEIAEIFADCKIFIDAGGRDARAFLVGMSADRRAVYGRNHWRAVLIEALAAHANLDRWIAAA